MTTIIEFRKANGDIIGRCDERCHTAKTEKCVCICGGKNHGVGSAQAIANSVIFPDLSAGAIKCFTRLQQTEFFSQEEEPPDLE